MPKKILIVDDEFFIRALLEQALEDFTGAGVELLSVDEGEKAWDVILAERPDLIVLDLMLPGTSGYEICQRIKDDPALSSIYVIMLTARGQLTDRQRGLAVGADEYITKPFDPKQLVERIANVLDITV
jgi:DNA-binding response OmpR family regulator